MRILQSALVASILLLGASPAVWAQQAEVKIGVLTDMSSPFSDPVGKGSVVAAQMAVADEGGQVLGQPATVVFADTLNKPDVGSTIAREWFDRDGVDTIVDLPNSSVALAVQKIARDRDRILLFSGAGSSDLTGPACAPLSVQWTYDTYSLSYGAAQADTGSGAKTWFFVTADNAFGQALDRDATKAIIAKGGKVIGRVMHPYASTDMATYLLQAQSSGAQIIAFSNAGSDFVNSVKQAHEFGLVANGQTLVGLIVNIDDVHGLGLQVAQGLTFTDAFYWDRTEQTREFSERFFKQVGTMPSLFHAGIYSAVRHYLQAVKTAQTKDGKAVMAAMRAAPIHDIFADNGTIREDGRMVHDMFLAQVKTPAESKGEWDLLKIVKTLPADLVTRPLDQGGCPLVAQKGG